MRTGSDIVKHILEFIFDRGLCLVIHQGQAFNTQLLRRT